MHVTVGSCHGWQLLQLIDRIELSIQRLIVLAVPSLWFRSTAMSAEH